MPIFDEMMDRVGDEVANEPPIHAQGKHPEFPSATARLVIHKGKAAREATTHREVVTITLKGERKNFKCECGGEHFARNTFIKRGQYRYQCIMPECGERYGQL